MDPSMELHAKMQAIEQACTAIQMRVNPSEAEAILLSFRQSHHPYHTCQYILEHSQMPIARFQAAATLQEAALREWTILSDEEKNGMWMYCLQLAMASTDTKDGYVQVKVLAVAAVLVKRGWIDFGDIEKESFFSKIREAVRGINGLYAQFLGITFLDSLVSEFSLSTASAMGLPREFHEQCRVSFEKKYLQQLFLWTQEVAFNVSHQVVNGSEMEVKVCAASLRLMCHILNWDFRRVVSVGISNLGGKNRRNTSFEHSFIQPGPAWRELLLSSNFVNWLLGFYLALRQVEPGNWHWIDSPLAVSCRELTLQLCCLTGNIFPSDGNPSQEQHLRCLLSSIVKWIDPIDTEIAAIKSGKSDSELIDCCRALYSVASLTSPEIFNGLISGSSRYSGTLEFISILTCEILKAEIKDDDENPWRMEALGTILDVWTVFFQHVDGKGRNNSLQLGMMEAAHVFKTIVETELNAARISAYDEDPNEELGAAAAAAARDEKLSAFALIARAAPTVTIPLLSSLFSERVSLLYQAISSMKDPVPTLEELHWLLYASGHIIADTGDGETPLVPESIQFHFSSVTDPQQHPVVILSRYIIDFSTKCLEPSVRNSVFSPRLMEACVWFLARWTGTYLMPVNSSHSSTALDIFGEQNQGIVVLQTLLHIAMAALTAWPGEHSLLEITCFQLIHALVQNRNICAQLILLEQWKGFTNAFANEKALLQLPAIFQRSLAETLCHSARGLRNSDASNQFVRDVMAPITKYLVDLSQKTDLLTFAQKPDVIFLVSSLVERLRGAARATEPRTQRAIFETGAAVSQPLLKFLEVYKNQPFMVCVLVKFTVDWVDGQLSFLEARDTALLFNFCLQLLKVYSAHNIGKVSLNVSKNMQNEVEAEKYKDLRALLKLLTSLCSKDLVDFSSGSQNEAENPDVSQIVYLGLHIITPLISVELMKYPKLCHQYFSLLVHMLEVYPEKVVKLSTEAFEQIVGILDFGLHQQDIDVVNMTLSALNSIASYHYKAVCNGHEGLGIHNASSQGPNREIPGVLSCFLKALLHFLLFEDYSNELVGPSADALFPLVLCDTSLYQRMTQEILQSQKYSMCQSRLAEAFHCLLNTNNLSTSLDRANRQRFRQNLHQLLVNVRGLLRTM